MEEFGKRIRGYRLHRNLTQERLAELLNVTAQAVSKWETGVSCPDIALLPRLSAELGVTLDELFATGEETHLARIDAMIEDGAVLSEEDFRYAEKQLKAYWGKTALRGRCLTMLSELYLARAEHYRSLAADTAREALALEPDKKANHAALSRAMNGVMPDWCMANHTALIDYYKGFVAAHGDYAPGYLWLLDNLIADGRLAEARQVVEQMRAVRDSYHYPLYLGLIAEKAGDRAEAERCWDDMVAQYPDTWLTWSSRADAHARCARYDLALADYRQAAARQEVPRYTDVYDSIAQICAIVGDTEGAIAAYETVLDILAQDWHLTEGETVQGYMDNIHRLRENGR